VLSSQFPTLKTTSHTPYIVRDRVIFGELFSLIQLESPWCRGYMMLQTEEEPLLELIGRDGAPGTVSSFRSVNDLLSEITNLVWGSFKNRFIGNSDRSSASRIEVPIIVNHKHRYVSFGTEKPQLCFRFTLSDEITGRSTKLYERFIFNLNWSPDNFQEIPKDVEDLVDAGELELL